MECNFKIERDPHVNSYTVISNASNGKMLSLAAKGLLKELLSLPQNWHLSIGGLATILKDGQSAIMSALKELEKNGYITRQKQFAIDKCGRRVFDGYFYTIFENPHNAFQCIEIPYTENPNTEIPYTENQKGINNNKEINKDNKDFNKDNKDNIYITPSDEGVTFEQFWDAYDYKKSKKDAERAWKKLSKADKGAAMKAIPAYHQDCVRCNRHRQYAATYLNKRTFEDDFSFNDNKENDNGRADIGLAGKTANERVETLQERIRRENDDFLNGKGEDRGLSESIF